MIIKYALCPNIAHNTGCMRAEGEIYCPDHVRAGEFIGRIYPISLPSIRGRPRWSLKKLCVIVWFGGDNQQHLVYIPRFCKHATSVFENVGVQLKSLGNRGRPQNHKKVFLVLRPTLQEIADHKLFNLYK